MTERRRIWLIDSCAIINIKKAVPAGQQWLLLRRLEEMVVAGELAFPRQVLAEVTRITHPDAPGVWADGVFRRICHPTEPDFELLREVMASPAGQVVDPNKDQEDGDPYVLALALQLRRAGEDVCVVTDDHREHADHTSMVSACDHLSLAWCRLADLLDQVRARDVAAQVSGPRADHGPRYAQDQLF